MTPSPTGHHLNGANLDAIEIVAWLKNTLALHGTATLTVQNPDVRAGAWPGERDAEGRPHRDLRGWLDLADGLAARLEIPARHESDDHSIMLTFHARGGEADLHQASAEPAVRYGPGGAFSRLVKPEHPGFLLPLLDALEFAAPTVPDRVLVVGCHEGDELSVLTRRTPASPEDTITGIDREAAALTRARSRYPMAHFIEADLLNLEAPGWNIGRFDLILILNVLQSPALDAQVVLGHILREHTAPRGGLIVGVPASRLIDGGVVWGARTRNFSETDLSLVVRDLAGHRRYLHQHGYRTRITGRYDLLLTARREQMQ